MTVSYVTVQLCSLQELRESNSGFCSREAMESLVLVGISPDMRGIPELTANMIQRTSLHETRELALGLRNFACRMIEGREHPQKSAIDHQPSGAISHHVFVHGTASQNIAIKIARSQRLTGTFPTSNEWQEHSLPTRGSMQCIMVSSQSHKPSIISHPIRFHRVSISSYHACRSLYQTSNVVSNMSKHRSAARTPHVLAISATR